MAFRLRSQLSSLGVQFGLLMAGLTIPLGLLQTWQFSTTSRAVQNQVAETQTNYLRLYQNSVDRDLQRGVQVLEDVAERSVLSQDELSREVRLHTALRGIFTMAGPNETILTGHSAYVDDLELDDLSWWFRNSRSDVADEWQLVTWDGEWYLVYWTLERGRFWGAWVDVDQFLQPLFLIDSGQGSRSFFLTPDRNPIPPNRELESKGIELREIASGSLVGTFSPYLFVSVPSRAGSWDLGVVLPQARYQQDLPSFVVIYLLTAAASLGALAVFVILFRKIILRPLGLLTSAMSLTDGDDLESRIDFTTGSREMALIRDTFNSMVERIHSLKINVYEERLHTQQEELNFLQLQLNPHFFLNSLNILYQLAEVPDLPLLQELVVRLSRYFRFMHTGSRIFLPLRDELDHTENYFEIQKVRFPGRLHWNLKVSNAVLELPVPPLVLHTFVENSIKYGLTKDRDLSIFVEIERKDSQVLLRIVDDGPGFSAPILAKLAAGQRIFDGEREHIGITNVRRRLQLLYGTKAFLVCQNVAESRGAFVELTLPAPREWTKPNAIPRSISEHR